MRLHWQCRCRDWRRRFTMQELFKNCSKRTLKIHYTDFSFPSTVSMLLCSTQSQQQHKKPQKFDKIHNFDIGVGMCPISLKWISEKLDTYLFTWRKLILPLRKPPTKNLISVNVSHVMRVSDRNFFWRRPVDVSERAIDVVGMACSCVVLYW